MRRAEVRMARVEVLRRKDMVMLVIWFVGSWWKKGLLRIALVELIDASEMLYNYNRVRRWMLSEDVLLI